MCSLSSSLNHYLPRVLGGAPRCAVKFRKDTLAVYGILLLVNNLLMEALPWFHRVYALLEPDRHRQYSLQHRRQISERLNKLMSPASSAITRTSKTEVYEYTLRHAGTSPGNALG